VSGGPSKSDQRDSLDNFDFFQSYPVSILAILSILFGLVSSSTVHLGRKECRPTFGLLY